MEMGLLYRHNIISLNSMDSFANIRGGYNNNLRDVYFIRVIGEKKDLNKSIESLDRLLEEEMGKNHLKYLRINSLPQMNNISDSNFYTKSYDEWTRGEKIKFRNINMNTSFEGTFKNAIQNVITQFISSGKGVSDTIVRNFTIKLFFWLDSIGKNLFSQWNEKQCTKIIGDNVIKKQEYLFYLMLTFLGCDVMLIQNRGDIDTNELKMNYSCEIKIGEFGESIIENYNQKYDLKNTAQKIVNTTYNNKNLNKVVIPERTRKKPKQETNDINANSKIQNTTTIQMQSALTEKTFEELARLASSVVLIAIHDKDGDIIGTGSGIMIGKNGFILTNNHVASGGKFYTVRIEEDDKAYTTDEVIKYNSVTDLAVIRIGKQLNPIPIYRGKKKLVRGQKVVAIGSPLGLFNSVSDGIISGFRNINDVDMIQFTAPISHGSSGGAVINMQGEVIGISTAGIDSGQNINLAIGYENILMFTKGFY